MFSIREIGLDFFLPAMIVAAGVAAGWRQGAGIRAGRGSGAIAFSLGFAIGFCAIGGVPRWPPGSGDASFWLIWFSVPIALLGLLDAFIQPPLWLRFAMGLGLFWVGLYLLLCPLKRGWNGQGASFGFWTTALSVIGTAWWLGLENEAEHRRGPLMPAIMGIAAAGAALILGITQNLKSSEGALALAAMAASATVVAFFFPRLTMARGAVLAFATPLFGLLVFVQFYAYTSPPLLSGVILLAAPLLAGLGDWPSLSNRRMTKLSAQLLPVIAATAIAVALAIRGDPSM